MSKYERSNIINLINAYQNKQNKQKNRQDKLKEMKTIEKLLFKYLKEEKYDLIENLLLKILKVPKDDLYWYNIIFNHLKKKEITDIQRKATAFYLSRLLYVNILTDESLNENKNNSNLKYENIHRIYELTKENLEFWTEIFLDSSYLYSYVKQDLFLKLAHLFYQKLGNRKSVNLPTSNSAKLPTKLPTSNSAKLPTTLPTSNSAKLHASKNYPIGYNRVGNNGGKLWE
jgi:hypothetical protein